MDTQLIAIIRTDKLNPKEKYDIFSEKLQRFCNEPEHLINCYRILKVIEFELSLIRKQNDTNIDEYTIAKLSHSLKTELEIIRWKIKHPMVAEVKQKKDKPFPVFHWTGGKIDLVELIYAIQAYINNGVVSIHALKTCFECIFQIDLSNIYYLAGKIAKRKKTKTRFLDKLTLDFGNTIENLSIES